jgi:hypothetical protein
MVVACSMPIASPSRCHHATAGAGLQGRRPGGGWVAAWPLGSRGQAVYRPIGIGGGRRRMGVEIALYLIDHRSAPAAP